MRTQSSSARTLMEARAKLRLRSKGSELAPATRREGAAAAAAGDLSAAAAAAAASIARHSRHELARVRGLGRAGLGICSAVVGDLRRGVD